MNSTKTTYTVTTNTGSEELRRHEFNTLEAATKKFEEIIKNIKYYAQEAVNNNIYLKDYKRQQKTSLFVEITKETKYFDEDTEGYEYTDNSFENLESFSINLYEAINN